MKQRFWLFIGGIALLAIIIVAASAASSGSRGKPQGTSTCTISSAIGITQIKITNFNTGTSITKTAADLPYTFYYSNQDTLSFNATVAEGYVWNAWEINQSPWFDNHNPLSMKASGNLALIPTTLMEP